MNNAHGHLSREIDEAASRLEVTVEPERREKLVAYALELERWNRRINLIRFRDHSELVHRHLADGMAAARHIPQDAASLVDVGAGAGIPGIVIAALRPDLEVVSLEPTNKKCAFLRAIRRTLPLKNYAAHADRLEASGGSPLGLEHRFDVAISRATWPLAEWLELGAGLVRAGGRVIGLEGRERGELPPRATRHPYASGDRQRAIVVRPVGSG